MKPARLKALTSLLVLQKRNSNTARMELAQCLAEEKRIEGRISRLKAQMEENRRLVSASREEAAQDLTLWNGYRHWLPVAREELERLEQCLEEARAESAAVRGRVMGLVRRQEATSGLLHRDRLEQTRQKQQQEQAILDEQAQHRRRAETPDM